jgi:hypothetical protein
LITLDCLVYQLFTEPRSKMSTRRHPTATTPEFKTASTFTAENAPRTFDPYNTNPAPEMFDDKWQATAE